jgi:hypothetical protein
MAFAPLNLLKLGDYTTFYHFVNKQKYIFQNFRKILLWDGCRKKLIPAIKSAYGKQGDFHAHNKFFRRSAYFRSIL